LNALLKILLALCLLAAGTCVGMMVSQRRAASRPASVAPAAALALASASAPATAAARNLPVVPANASPRPLLWKVSDQDNDLYLLGSFHALKPSDYPVAPAVDAAFEDAELVAFEVSPEEMNSPELGMQMMQAAMDPEGGLQGALDDATWKRLQAYCSTRGLPMEQFQSFEPWFVALIVQLSEMGRVGYDPKQGLDQHLIARAASEHKRTLGLETGASQIAVLDSMTPLEQRQSLAEALDGVEDSSDLDELHAMWRNGDDAALDQKLTVEFKRDYAQLYQRINVDRNQAWLPKLRAMLDDSHSDDALVVVGAMHLIGPDGVVNLLRKQGYRVERL
jgi:uncharacterized protein YbaP (TraB family)